jgi:hypothetical protein
MFLDNGIVSDVIPSDISRMNRNRICLLQTRRNFQAAANEVLVPRRSIPKTYVVNRLTGGLPNGRKGKKLSSRLVAISSKPPGTLAFPR